MLHCPVLPHSGVLALPRRLCHCPALPSARCLVHISQFMSCRPTLLFLACSGGSRRAGLYQRLVRTCCPPHLPACPTPAYLPACPACPACSGGSRRAGSYQHIVRTCCPTPACLPHTCLPACLPCLPCLQWRIPEGRVVSAPCEDLLRRLIVLVRGGGTRQGGV